MLRIDEMAPAVRSAIKQFDEDITSLEINLKTSNRPTVEWNTLMDRLEIAKDPLQRLWGIVVHLMSVQNSQELRDVHGLLQGEVVTIFTRFAQSETIFNAYHELRASSAWNSFNEAQKVIINSAAIDEYKV
jgi:oligopeptidase A